MNVLVTAASKHGSTEEIARALAQRLRSRGLTVVEARPDDASLAGLAGFDAVVVGSAVYAGRWLPVARTFVSEHADELRGLPVWAFSSGPVGSPPQPAEECEDGAELVERVGARAHRTFVGTLNPSKLSFFERGIARLVRASAEDRRDWEAISAFADEIASELAATPLAGPAV